MGIYVFALLTICMCQCTDMPVWSWGHKVVIWFNTRIVARYLEVSPFFELSSIVCGK